MSRFAVLSSVQCCVARCKLHWEIPCSGLCAVILIQRMCTDWNCKAILYSTTFARNLTAVNGSSSKTVLTAVCCQSCKCTETWTKTISGAFKQLLKATISFVVSVCRSVPMEQLASRCVDFHEI